MIDPIILGDNPFYGINHRAEAQGAHRGRPFENLDRVLDILRLARFEGAGGLMLSAHANASELVKRISQDPELRDFRIYPQIPYLMKYVSQVTKHGIGGAITSLLSGPAAMLNIGAMLQGGLGLFTKDYFQLMRSFVDLEMAAYGRGRVRAIFLHNGIVDLALGLGMEAVFFEFRDYLLKKYEVEAGFGTLNLSMLAEFLKRSGYERPLIMAPFNAHGFFMNPSREASESALEKYDFTLLAMNVLAQGALKPAEAFGYLKKFPKIKHVAIGASRAEHVKESLRWARETLAPRMLAPDGAVIR